MDSIHEQMRLACDIVLYLEREEIGSIPSNFLEGPNPHNNQSNGIIIELHDRSCALLTPLGRWCIRIYQWREAEKVRELFSQVISSLKYLGKGKKLDWGYEAEYYAIGEARQREEDEYIPYDKAKATWTTILATIKEGLLRKR